MGRRRTGSFVVTDSGTWWYLDIPLQMINLGLFCIKISLFCIKTPIFCIIYHGFRLSEQYEAEYVLDRAHAAMAP